MIAVRTSSNETTSLKQVSKVALLLFNRWLHTAT